MITFTAISLTPIIITAMICLTVLSAFKIVDRSIDKENKLIYGHCPRVYF